MLKKTNILGVNITNETEEKILEYVVDATQKPNQKVFITTPNPEIIMYAQKHKAYKDKLNEAEVSLPDGVGVLLAGLLKAEPFSERVTGVDFMDKLCLVSEKNPMSIGFLGGGSGIANRTAECLKKKYPRMKVVFASEEWDKSLINNSNKKEIDILFVAFGFPKQEEWIHKNLPHLPVKVAMGVGGAFDFISGEVVRAPYLIRAMGFEWLFRLAAQPWRIRRQFALVEFATQVLKERFHKKTS